MIQSTACMCQLGCLASLSIRVTIYKTEKILYFPGCWWKLNDLWQQIGCVGAIPAESRGPGFTSASLVC